MWDQQAMDRDPYIKHLVKISQDSSNHQAVNEDPLALGGIALAWSFEMAFSGMSRCGVEPQPPGWCHLRLRQLGVGSKPRASSPLQERGADRPLRVQSYPTFHKLRDIVVWVIVDGQRVEKEDGIAISLTRPMV
jgi:hypothetical protein